MRNIITSWFHYVLSYILPTIRSYPTFRAFSVGSHSYRPTGPTASFLSSLPSFSPAVKHNINNLEYIQKLNNNNTATVLNTGDYSSKTTSPLHNSSDTDPPLTRKRSQTRILNTEKMRELFNEATIVLENLKTALEGKMEVKILFLLFYFLMFYCLNV